VLFHFIEHLMRQTVALIKHREHDALERELRIYGLLDQINGLDQIGSTLQAHNTPTVAEQSHDWRP
jgi:hypothetical protein